MQADEQVGSVFLGDFDPFRQWNEVVAPPGQESSQIRAGVNCRLQPPGHRQDDILFLCSLGADGSAILAAMAWVDDNDSHSLGLQLLRDRLFSFLLSL